MLLAIDIGNTNIKLGIFDGDRLKAVWNLATDIHHTSDEYGGMVLNLMEREKVGSIMRRCTTTAAYICGDV